MRTIVYSHSDYYDCLNIFAAQADKFGLEFTVFSNKEYPGRKTFIYDENLSYSERLAYCLEQIEDETVLYLHEDMIPIKKPFMNCLKYCEQFMTMGPFNFVRLAKTGNLFIRKVNTDVHEIASDSPDFFAVQPSIWHRKSLIKFLRAAGPKSIWELELEGTQFNEELRGLLYFEGTEGPIGGHYQSGAFPYIATAVVKSKWNMSEYGPELEVLFKENNIDKNIRGWI